MKVTIVHMRKAGFCAHGAKVWFEARGMDFKDFIRNGADIDVAKGMGDPMADRLVEIVERETNA